jgi:hypothetical protein
MSITEVRNRFHVLIDEVENPLLLQKFLEIMKTSAKPSKAKLWDTLSELEKGEVIEAYEESKQEKNLVSNKEVMNKYKKWLKK